MTSREVADCVGDADVAPLDDERLAAVAKAIGHPVRVKILRLLEERTTCVSGDLAAEFPLAQSTVSEHLRVLRDAGLIQGEIEGARVSYCLNTAALAAFRTAVDAL